MVRVQLTSVQELHTDTGHSISSSHGGNMFSGRMINADRKQSSTSSCGLKGSTSRKHFQRSVLHLRSSSSRIVSSLDSLFVFSSVALLADGQNNRRKMENLTLRRPTVSQRGAKTQANIKRSEWRSTRTKVGFFSPFFFFYLALLCFL